MQIRRRTWLITGIALLLLICWALYAVHQHAMEKSRQEEEDAAFIKSNTERKSASDSLPPPPPPASRCPFGFDNPKKLDTKRNITKNLNATDTDDPPKPVISNSPAEKKKKCCHDQSKK